MKKTSFNEFSRNLDLGSIKFSLTQREDGPNWSLSKAGVLVEPALLGFDFLGTVDLFVDKKSGSSDV